MPFMDLSNRPKHAPNRSTPNCGKCKLFSKCKSPKLETVFGKEGGVFIVQTQPSKGDDDVGWFVNALKCQHWKNIVAPSTDYLSVSAGIRCNSGTHSYNDKWQMDWESHCQPWLISDIKKANPTVIITLDPVATRTVIKYDYHQGADSYFGTYWPEIIPSQKFNAWVIPMMNPADLSSKNPKIKQMIQTNESVISANLKFARLAFQQRRRPWPDGPPDYKEMCKLYFNEEEAAEAIISMLNDEKTEAIAFDYETTTLKPESPHAKIYTVSFSNGHDTIAMPWYQKVRKAARDVFNHPVPKIAANLKFEERWTIQEYGRGVRNWLWDTMQAAHWLNQRPNITSIKFQAYARLGQPSYNQSVEPYLKSPNPLLPNKIDSIDKKSLLTYNALDSLLELLVAIEQMESSKFPDNPFMKESFRALRPARTT